MRELIKDRTDIDGMQFLRYEPGTGTSYPLVFIPMPRAAIGWQWSCEQTNPHGRVLIVLNWARPTCMFVNSPPHWSYVAEKMGLGSADAEQIANIARYVLQDMFYAP